MTLDLTAFEGLQHNWDGEDAIAPELETIENFRSIVSQLTWPEFDIFADNNGTMDIESAGEGKTTFHLSVGVSRYSMYVKLAGDERIVYYCDGMFGVDTFPVSEVQTVLDTLLNP